MKLSEAFAILESGKVVEFEATPTSGRRSVLYRNGKYFMIDTYSSNGEKIEFYAPAGAFNKNFSTDLDWQLVRQPVTWQEAIQAWVDGKVVCVENKAGGRVYRHGGEGEKMNLLQSEITTGIWYVED